MGLRKSITPLSNRILIKDLPLCCAEPSKAYMEQGAPDRGRLWHSEPAQLWRLWGNDPPLGPLARGCC